MFKVGDMVEFVHWGISRGKAEIVSPNYSHYGVCWNIRLLERSYNGAWTLPVHEDYLTLMAPEPKTKIERDAQDYCDKELGR